MWGEAGARAFRDGVELTATGGDKTAPFMPTDQRFVMGLGLVGEIDEITLYDGDLTAAQAAALP